MGLDWNRGDEAVISNQDYPSIVAQFDQACSRWGIVVRRAALPLHPVSDEEIVAAFEKRIGPRTRLLLLTHLLHVSGQVLPAAKIIDMAHERGVEVLVDGAQSFAHLDFKIRDLRCDYFASSLHKWLGAPLGLGLLFVRRDRIQRLWALFGAGRSRRKVIAKFEHLGTRPVPAILTIEEALRFHRLVGSGRKLARLRFLKHFWVNRAKDLPGVVIMSPLEEQRGGAIACFSKKGQTPACISKFLWNRHRIFSVGIGAGRVKGVRITPHLYTTPGELDLLVKGISECQPASR
jgi:selenocysteine lyase/cysteine desulfurase